jgi:hypothetical protein
MSESLRHVALSIWDDDPDHAEAPAPPEPVDRYPLVYWRQRRRKARRGLTTEQQSRWCQGFEPDWFLAEPLCSQWRSPWYPATPTREAVEKWQELIRAVRLQHAGPLGAPHRAAELDANRDNDLALIRQCRPDLLEPGPRQARPDDFIRAKCCRDEQITTHRRLVKLLGRVPNDEGGIRWEHRGNHLFIHSGDWMRWRANRDDRDREAVARAADAVVSTMKSGQGRMTSKKKLEG